MNLKERINAFSLLGKQLQELPPSKLMLPAQEAEHQNPWFTLENIKISIKSIINFLHQKTLEQWTANYLFSSCNKKVIRVIMAGNIPLVGFHDLLSVLISGHTLQARLSSKDSVLLPHIANMLIALEPRFSKKISFKSPRSCYDAVIATGSDNSSRYFNSYFKNIPHIIRKSRTSCAILTGKETTEELNKLGEDVTHYFGLGCRSVSKLYLPQNYNLAPLLKQWEPYSCITNNHKYAHNYNYQKALLLTNKEPFLDTNAILLVENEQLEAPIAVVYYELYKDRQDLIHKIGLHNNKLQCVVTHSTSFPQGIPFGKSQFPTVWEYADGIDTLAFIGSLH